MAAVIVQHYRYKTIAQLLLNKEKANLDVQPPSWTINDYDLFDDNESQKIQPVCSFLNLPNMTHSIDTEPTPRTDNS